MDAKHVIVLALMLTTLAVLIVGVVTMMRGGENNRQKSNKLMSLRVMLQGATILLLGLMFISSK